MVLHPLLLQWPHHCLTTLWWLKFNTVWSDVSSSGSKVVCYSFCMIQQCLRLTQFNLSTPLFIYYFRARLKLLLSSDCKSNFLPLDASFGTSTVLQELKSQHSSSLPIHCDSMISSQLPNSDTWLDIIFENLDGMVIRQSCLKINEVDGRSRHWLCTSINTASSPSVCVIPWLQRHM